MNAINDIISGKKVQKAVSCPEVSQGLLCVVWSEGNGSWLCVMGGCVCVGGVGVCVCVWQFQGSQPGVFFPIGHSVLLPWIQTSLSTKKQKMFTIYPFCIRRATSVPLGKRYKIRIASRENVDNQTPCNTNFTH